MLYLSTTTAYGLNLLIELVRAGDRISLAAISDKTGMPYRFLTKIVRSLVSSGLVEAKEGKGGGYMLAKKPDQIKLSDIFAGLGEPLSLTICHTKKGCPMKNEKQCRMRPIWTKIKKNLDTELNKYTLKDLI